MEMKGNGGRGLEAMSAPLVDYPASDDEKHKDDAEDDQDYEDAKNGDGPPDFRPQSSGGAFKGPALPGPSHDAPPDRSSAAAAAAAAGSAPPPRVVTSAMSLSTFAQEMSYIPLRLTEDERRLLAVLENALEVCEYTDIVDVTFSHLGRNKQSRIMTSLVDMLSIACGLMMSNNLSRGETLISGRSLDDNVPMFAELFEIGRRYKIMNPTKMRGTYGKMMYLLMDTRSPNFELRSKLDFVKEILTVETFLTSRGLPRMCADPLLAVAAGTDIVDGDLPPALHSLSREAALNLLCEKYCGGAGGSSSGSGSGSGSGIGSGIGSGSSSSGSGSGSEGKGRITRAEIERIVQSIADNQAYLVFNVLPVEAMIALLKENFSPTDAEDLFSLALTSKPRARKETGYYSSSSYTYLFGKSSYYRGEGACLVHDHGTQYLFVLQSLTLWAQIMQKMPRLWLAADSDLTMQSYRLADTGQGYQRLQSCPSVRGIMNSILESVRHKCGPWVGLSVVHLGDRDVPNALVFIDKYVQVPSILAPIASAIAKMPALEADEAFHKYVCDQWGEIAGLRKQILSDFFKHGFDGSGDDGGSCIDGRLTSAWNWCSKLHKKPFYHVFMFTGFQGFDGDWKEN